MGTQAEPVAPDTIESLRARLEARRRAISGQSAAQPDAPAQEVNLDHRLQELRRQHAMSNWQQGETLRSARESLARPVAADVSATDRSAMPQPPRNPPPTIESISPGEVRNLDQAAQLEQAATRRGKVRALLPGAAPASFVERAVGRGLAHLPGAVGDYGTNLAQMGEEHGREEALGHAALPWVASLPADIGNLWLELEAGGRIPGPLGRIIGSEYAAPIRASVEGELAAPGVAATVGRVLRMGGREAARFGTLEATKGVVAEDDPETVFTNTLLGTAQGAAWGSGSQALREGVARMLALAIKSGRVGVSRTPGQPPKFFWVGGARAEPAPAAAGQLGGTRPGTPYTEAQEVHTPPAPKAPATNLPEPLQRGGLEQLEEDMEAGKYTPTQLKQLRARLFAGQRDLAPNKQKLAQRVVDAIDEHLQAQGIAGASREETPPGEAQRPGEALHDHSGKVIPGTEVTPAMTERRGEERRQTNLVPPEGEERRVGERRLPEGFAGTGAASMSDQERADVRIMGAKQPPKPITVEGFRGVPEGHDPREPGVAGSIFSSPSRETAQSYGPSVHRVRTTLKNPLHVASMDDLWKTVYPDQPYPHYFNAADIQERVVPKLREMGYDGAVIENKGEGGPEVVAFDPRSVQPVTDIHTIRVDMRNRTVTHGTETVPTAAEDLAPKKPATPQVPSAPGQKYVLPGFATGGAKGKPAPSADRQANIDAFTKVWEPILQAAAKKDPAHYGHQTPEQITRTVERMAEAFNEPGTYTHSSSMKAAQRRLGIKPTAKALEEYFAGPVGPRMTQILSPGLAARRGVPTEGTGTVTQGDVSAEEPEPAAAEPATPDAGRTVQSTIEEANQGASPEDLAKLVDAAKRLLDYEKSPPGDPLPRDPRAVRAWVEKVLNRPYSSGTWTTDDAYDAIEVATNQWAHEGLGPMKWQAGPILDRLKTALEIEEKVFGTRTRTEAMVARQQFSTPLPIAEAAQFALDIEGRERVLEPTAGTGNLINSLRGTGVEIHANELDPRRRALLEHLEPAIIITGEDALRLQLSPQKYNAIIMNPPFGGYNLKGKYSGKGATEFTASDLSQRFVAAALRSLATGGRLVAIMPEGLMGKTASDFRKWLYNKYSVPLILEAPAGSYKTRGTEFGTWMLVVDNVGRMYAADRVEVTRDPSWDLWREQVARLGGAGDLGRREGHEPTALAKAPLSTPSSSVAQAAQEMAAAVKQAVKEAVQEVRDERADRPAEGSAQPTRDLGEGMPAGSAGAVGGERGTGSGGLAPEPGSGAAPGGAGSAGVVAEEGPARSVPAEPGPAPSLVPRLARRRTEPGRLDSPERRAEIQAANDSAVFTPYERGTEQQRNPHPRLVVETRSQAGMPAPALAVTTFQSKLIDKAWGRSGADGGISDDQADMALQTLSAWDRGHGFLVAADVGVGKSRIGATLILEALARGKTRILYTTKNETNLVDVQRELRMVATGKPDGDFPATFILGQDYPKAATRGGRERTEKLPTPKGPVVYLLHSYNFEPLNDSVLEVDPDLWIADEAHEYKNAFAKRGMAWQRLHGQMIDRGHHEIAYLTATPAVTLDEMGYLYGLKEWRPGGFNDWVSRKLGKAGEGDVGDQGAINAQHAADTALGESHSAGDVAPNKKKPFFRDSADAFSGRITPAETEQVMRELKGLGKFRANDLWRGGVEFEVAPVDLLGDGPEAVKARARYDSAAELCREITKASRKFGYLNEKVKTTGLERSLIQSYMKQLLFDLRLPTILKKADVSLKAGRQVVVSVHSVTGDVDADEGLSDAETEVPLNKRLEAAINRINTKEVKKIGEGDDVEFVDLGEIPEALAKRAELLDRLKALPPLVDPVRALEEHFGAKNLATITGKIAAQNRVKQMGEFQSGKRKVALISKAGKIGISLHDVNGAARHLIVGDYEWSADVFKQELGRVDRTGQRSKPLISLVASNIAGERKFASTIAARMSTLGATSKGAAEATGTDALDQFEATGDIPVAAMKNAIEKLSDDLRQYFTGSKFVEAQQMRQGAGVTFSAKRRPDDADMRSFFLEMLMFPVDASNKVLEAWVREREALMTGDAVAAAEARKTGKLTGRVQRETVLTKGNEPHLAMYEVQNEVGEHKAILQGFVTPHITTIQNARGTDERGYTRPRRYVSFTDTASGESISGLEVAVSEARRIKTAFGAGERRYLTPGDVHSDLGAGDDVKVQGHDMAQWVLHPRRDGRIQIQGATLSKHRDVLKGYAQYEPVGNFLFVKDGDTQQGISRFLERFPVDQPKGEAPAPGFVPPEPSAARYERLGQILRSPLGKPMRELLRDRLIEGGHDQAEVETLDDRALMNRAFESQALTPEEESGLLDALDAGESGWAKIGRFLEERGGGGLSTREMTPERMARERARARMAAPAELSKPGVADALQKTFSPMSRTSGADEMATLIRAEKGREARLNETALEALRAVRKGFPSLDTAAGVEFADMMETGRPVDPQLEPAAKLVRSLLDASAARIQDLGTGKLEHLIADYLPHMWEKPDEARSILSKIMGRRPLQGPKSFLKRRKIPTIAEGIEAGLKPITADLLDLVMLKLREMNKYEAAQRIFQGARKRGLVKFVRAGKRAPAGYIRINDSIATVYGPFTDEGAMTVRGEFYAPEPIAAILNNHLSPGLRGHPIFDAYMFVGNAMNAVQLGLSAFHLGFVSLDAMVSQFALGLEQLVSGRIPSAVGNMATFWTAPFTTVLRGSKLRGEYLVPGASGGRLAELADAITAGGGRVRMDKFYKNSSVESFLDAAKKGRLPTAALHLLPAAMEFAAKPLMEWFVPRMKMGVFADLARFELSRLPPDATEDQVRSVMAKVWDSVDNRMGQLVYDNLFWNRTIKDLGMASVRALGWNLGSARELGGGLYDLGRRRFTHRGAYVIALPIVVGLLGALLMYLTTGHGPETLQDYFEPRTGKKDADGNDERVALPSYMKDVIGFFRHPVQTVTHKLHPLLDVIASMLENKDYWGGEIRNPHDPLVVQLKQAADYVATQFTPLGVRNFREQGRRLQTGPRAMLPFIGVTPANREAVRSRAQNLMAEYLRASAPSSATPEESEQRRTRADITARFHQHEINYGQARQELMAAGLRGDQVADALRRMMGNPLVERFKGLTLEQAEEVFAVGTPSEQALWRPTLFKKRAEQHPRNPPRIPRPRRQ